MRWLSPLQNGRRDIRGQPGERKDATNGSTAQPFSVGDLLNGYRWSVLNDPVYIESYGDGYWATCSGRLNMYANPTIPIDSDYADGNHEAILSLWLDNYENLV